MSQTAAKADKPKSRRGGHRPGHPPPGGRMRTRAEVLKLMDVCEEAVILELPRHQVRALMGKAAGLPGPMSAKTTADYIARVNQRHAENPLPELVEARERAARRYQKVIAGLVADGRTKNEAAILRWETRLAALRGLDAIRDKEAVEAAALAIVMEKINRARLEKEAALTLREQEEAERQRVIDIGEAVPGKDEHGR